MDKRTRWWRILAGIGLAGMILGLLDPLEGSVVILAGIALVTLGAWIGRTRSRKLISWACGLVLVGVGMLFYLSSRGGVGGDTGRSAWLLLLCLPYPAGWILGFAGIMRDLRGAFTKSK
jgi:hypothetical protein